MRQDKPSGCGLGAHAKEAVGSRFMEAAARPATLRREQLIALQDADCTTVGGEFDFSQALAESADESLSELGREMLHAVGIGFEVGGRLVIHGARGGLRAQVKGIVAREADFDKALAAL